MLSHEMIERTPTDAMVPPVVLDASRLAALDGHDILDTPPEEGFDDIVRLAGRLCDAPVALVSLVAADRQWFKARVGFPGCGTALNGSVCAYALAEPDLLVIPDLTQDPRTRDNPLVTDAPRIRFYAGAPLRTGEGHALGSLCVIDERPRPGGLTEAQADDLRALARSVMNLMEARRLLRQQHAESLRQEALIATQAAVAGAGGDLDASLDALVAGAMRALPQAEGGGVVLRTGGALTCRSGRGTLASPLGDPIALEGGLAADCLRSRAPIRVADVRGDPRVPPGLAEASRMRSCGLVPILRGETAIGVLALQSSRTGQFGESDLTVMRLFAGAVVAGFVEAAEASARRSVQIGEERLALAFEASGSLGWWDWDVPADRIYASEPFARAYGVDPSAAAAGAPVSAFVAGIHPDDRDWVGARIREVLDTAGEFAEEYRLLARDGTATWVYARGRCYHDAEGRPLRYPGVAIDITARKQASLRQSALTELGDRLRETSDAAEMAYAAADIMGRTFGATRAGYGTIDAARETVAIEADWCVPGMSSITGVHRFREYGSFIEDLKRGDLVAVSDVAADPRTAGNAEAFLALGIRTFVNVPLIEHGALVAVLFIHHARAHAWIEEDYALVRSIADRTRAAVARVRAEDRQAVLNEELSHRLKNTLALVQAIATQTLRAVPDREPVEAFEQRIHALATAHEVLLQRSLASARAGEVVTAVLTNFGLAERFDVSGPDFDLGPRTTMSLSLLLHELATNASKYGALSGETGRVAVAWRIEREGADAEVVLTWRERDGPPVRPPSGRGFGSRLIRMGLVGTGGVALDYHVDGLSAEMRAPLAQMQQS